MKGTPMKIQKQKLAELTKCYCVAPLTFREKPCFLVASEKEFSCLLFDADGQFLDEIWKEPGGTMSAVQLPGCDGAFLATHRFYSPNNCREASIVMCRYLDGAWQTRTLVSLLGVHRFDILNRNGTNYLIACTIKSDYEGKDDWRFPGAVMACPLPSDLLSLWDSPSLPLKMIREGLTKNHGYSRDGDTGIITSQEGVFRFIPPDRPDLSWKTEQLLDQPTSDALLIDLDGDGEKELLTLSPFHGDTLRIFRKIGAQYRPVFEYEETIPFAHAICPAALGERKVAVIGHRQGRRDLLAVDFSNGDYRVTVLDHDIGPTNALCIDEGSPCKIISANREINEIAYYTLTEE